MAKKPTNIATRYTHQCSSLGNPPCSTNIKGKAIKLAINKACRTKIPKYKRSNATLRRVADKAAGATPDSRCCNCTAGLGTLKAIIKIPSIAIAAVNQNNPDKPKPRVTNGPTTIATEKEMPDRKSTRLNSSHV